MQEFAVKAPDFYALEKLNKALNSSREMDGTPLMANGKPLTLRDCEWFTEFKRQRLHQNLGVPEDQMQKVYVATEKQNPDVDEPDHVVLRYGGWVLDNRYPRPYKYDAMLKKYREYPGWTTLKARK